MAVAIPSQTKIPGYIADRISELCPISGISFGNYEDKTTWKVNYAIGATDAQKKAVQDWIASYNKDAPTIIDIHSECIARKNLLPYKFKELILKNLLLLNKGVLSAIEQQQLEYIKSALIYINAVQDTTKTLKNTLPIDYNQSKYWPTPPVKVDI